MKRKITKDLQDWKDNLNRRPLIIRGARQVGKTYIVNEFAQDEFKNFITLNFERNPEYKSIFTDYDPVEIMEKIALYTGGEINPGKTLLFIDEIQECPQAIMALRYFYEEMPELHIIATGSLLEFTLRREDFRMPVGRVQYLYMYPLSFGEFLNAMDEESLYLHSLKKSNIASLDEKLHEKLITYIRKFFILGGMPAVLNEYIQSRNIIKCQKIQSLIIETYKDDFAKYAGEAKFAILNKVFEAVAAMIGQKFVYVKVDRSLKSREIKTALGLLETAGLVYRIKHSSGAGLPLEASSRDNIFKMLFFDIGLMHAINGLYGETIKEEDLTAVFKGAAAEQFVGQELLVLQENYYKAKLYYWVREAKNSNAEIDYMIEKEGEIIPIEVKSGASGRLKSLHMFLDNFQIEKGLKISQAPYKNETKILTFPFYGIESFLNNS